MSQDAGLPGAGAGNYQQRSRWRRGRKALMRVETRQCLDEQILVDDRAANIRRQEDKPRRRPEEPARNPRCGRADTALGARQGARQPRRLRPSCACA